MHDDPFIQHEQFRLNDNFRQYVETSNRSKKSILHQNSKKLLQKSCASTTGAQSYTVEITSVNRQFN